MCLFSPFFFSYPLLSPPDLKPRLKNHYRAHRLSFWLNLVPDLHRPGGDDVPNSHHDLENDVVVATSTVKPLSPPRNHSAAATSKQQIFSLFNLTTSTSYNASAPLSTRGAGGGSGSVKQSGSDTGDVTNDLGIGGGGTNSPQEDGFAAYSTALSVTIAIGCSLLILNVLIFAGVYYQRDKSRLNEPQLHHSTTTTTLKKRNENGQMPNNICGDLESLTIHSKSEAASTLLAHHHAIHHQHPPPEFADALPPQRVPPKKHQHQQQQHTHGSSNDNSTSMLPPHSLVAIGTNCGTMTKKNCNKSNLSSSQQQNVVMMDELRV